MTIIETGSTSKGEIIKVVKYSAVEKLYKGYPYGVIYIKADSTRESGFLNEYQAKEALAIELFREILLEVRKYLSYSGKNGFYKHYEEFLTFLKHCFDFKKVERAPDYSRDDFRSLENIYIVDYIKRRVVDNEVLEKIGKYKEYALLKEGTSLSLWFEFNMLSGSLFILNATLYHDGKHESILRLETNPDTFNFMCNYAAVMNH